MSTKEGLSEKWPDRMVLAAGALLAALAVALGAFGAHALAGRFGETQVGWWETAVQYQMWHALALVLVACAPLRRRRAIALLIGGGALVFAATLYLMALGLPRWLGAITPIGGAAMIAGWLLLAIEALRRR